MNKNNVRRLITRSPIVFMWIWLIQCSTVSFISDLFQKPVVPGVTIVITVTDSETKEQITSPNVSIPVSIQINDTNFVYKEVPYTGYARNGQKVFENPPNQTFKIVAWDNQKYHGATLTVERSEIPDEGFISFTLELRRKVTTITGRILNAEDYRPVKNASVTITGGNTTRSDNNGDFNLRVPNFNPSLVYSIDVTEPDYQVKTEQLTNIKLNQNNSHGIIYLEPQGVLEPLKPDESEYEKPDVLLPPR